MIDIYYSDTDVGSPLGGPLKAYPLETAPVSVLNAYDMILTDAPELLAGQLVGNRVRSEFVRQAAPLMFGTNSHLAGIKFKFVDTDSGEWDVRVILRAYARDVP